MHIWQHPKRPRHERSEHELTVEGVCAQYVGLIAVLSRADTELQTLFDPGDGRFVGDIDLHFDADRMLFSMLGDHGRWQVFEIKADGDVLCEDVGHVLDALSRGGGRKVLMLTEPVDHRGLTEVEP